MVRDGDEVERARELHLLSAIAAKRLTLRKAIGILDGERRPEELRVEALVGMHVGVAPVDVLEGVHRLDDQRLGLRGIDLRIVLERIVGGRALAPKQSIGLCSCGARP